MKYIHIRQKLNFAAYLSCLEQWHRVEGHTSNNGYRVKQTTVPESAHAFLQLGYVHNIYFAQNVGYVTPARESSAKVTVGPTIHPDHATVVGSYSSHHHWNTELTVIQAGINNHIDTLEAHRVSFNEQLALAGLPGINCPERFQVLRDGSNVIGFEWDLIIPAGSGGVEFLQGQGSTSSSYTLIDSANDRYAGADGVLTMEFSKGMSPLSEVVIFEQSATVVDALPPAGSLTDFLAGSEAVMKAIKGASE
jgi:hypothetical protein